MDQFDDIFKDIKRESLTYSERARIRGELLAYMSEHPAKAPYSVRALDALSAIGDSFGAQRSGSMRFFPATLALVLVVGVGTTYAAEGALPGDALYSVKLNINESVQGALAVSDTAKVSWNTERLERRLLEAEALIAAGELTPVTQQKLQTEIHATVEAFDKNVAKMAMKNGEATVAAAQSDLEASLIGHAEVLAVLSETNEDTQIAAQPLIASVLARAEAVQAARAGNEATVVARRDGKEIRAAALENKERAVKAVSAVRAKAASNRATTSDDVAPDSASIAEVAITIAEESLKEGDYGTAFTSFQEAIRTARTAEVHLDASERLNTDVRIFSRTTPDIAVSATMMMDVATSMPTFEERDGI